ncbi:hypothetical protein C8Q76DRAFT_45904 [Earliella scabrosa]|nr:hypothetical protein C8Q76DRAFT_45904 [Earliella scabrosa]
MNMLRVCHRWRATIRATPRFWRLIIVRGRELAWLHHCLQLCAPLRSQAQVFIYDHRALAGDLSVIREYAPSLRLLSFRLGGAWPPSLRALLTGEALPIQDVCLIVHDQQWVLRDIGLCSRSLPCLQTLRLARVAPPEDLSIYVNLRELNIRDVPFLTSSWLLRILGVCTNLEILEIVGLFQDGPILDRPAGKDRMSFPHIRRFTVEADGPPMILASLLTHLHLPNVTSVRLQCDDSIMHPDAQVHLALLFKSDEDRAAVIPFLPTLVSAELRMRDELYQLRGLDSEGRTVALVADSSPISWREDIALGLSDLAATFLGVTAGVTHLTINGCHYDYVSGDDIGRVLRHYPALESLTLLGNSTYVHCVWAALRPRGDNAMYSDEVSDTEGSSDEVSDTDDSGSAHGDAAGSNSESDADSDSVDNPSPVRCLRLKSIKVGDMESNDFINSSNSFFKHLLVALEARAEHGARLDRLELNLRHDTDLEYQKRRRRFMKRLTAVVDGEVVYNYLPDKLPINW